MRLEDLNQLAQRAAEAGISNDPQKIHQLLLSMGLDPRTLYQELEMSSRLADTHRDISYSNTNLALHSHAFYELIYCCNSCGAEYLVGSERYRLRRGDVIFVPPGISHRPLLPEKMDTPYTRYVLWLSPEFMDQFALLFPYPFTNKQAQANLLRTRGTPWESLGELFAKGIAEAEKRTDGWEAAVVGNTITLLTQMKRATDDRSAQGPEAEKPELLDRLIAYVEEHYTKNLMIEDLAKTFYISCSTVSHIFKQKLGVSFYRYVTQRRLISAKTQIEKGLPMDTVATESGFADYSGFYRAFRKEYGISPRQYRNLHETGERT